MTWTRRKGSGADFERAAEREASLAINHARQGPQVEALRAWRNLFGVKFPLFKFNYGTERAC